MDGDSQLQASMADCLCNKGLQTLACFTLHTHTAYSQFATIMLDLPVSSVNVSSSGLDDTDDGLQSFIDLVLRKQQALRPGHLPN
ncbi:MAG: hypothetical protein NVS3B11_23140 [Collimonas sp.]